MCHNWYYHVYESIVKKAVLFIYFILDKPFFPSNSFFISRRLKINTSSKNY
eukprot:UN02488